jgi:hypothetical protein
VVKGNLPHYVRDGVDIGGEYRRRGARNEVGVSGENVVEELYCLGYGRGRRRL